ncbi:hypothetical protein MUL_2831 [Mycobacterium ulcerans Agy99]|uniref:Uncharacterized protein n=1 Tax=Mycobacterium ulcerans (strain Agy99) TaxID=362242 RepID=A0PRZ8_MYCUA|nr:hypothetical protein MUL_2831 [Mycobacterium ulcerans Agy99]
MSADRQSPDRTPGPAALKLAFGYIIRTARLLGWHATAVGRAAIPATLAGERRPSRHPPPRHRDRVDQPFRRRARRPEMRIERDREFVLSIAL